MSARRPGPSETFLAQCWRAENQRRLRNRGRRIGAAALLIGLLVVLAGVLVVLRCQQNSRVADAKYLWVQLMPDNGTTRGGRLVRAIVTAGRDCPVVTKDRTTIAMDPRAPAVRAAFPILLCETVLLDGGEARVGSRLLPERPLEPDTIVVLGDTGCRMVHYQIQPCRSDDDWPFAAVAASAEKKASANRGRSIILHLGDQHYREHQCADFDPRCGGSPFGDNWATWEKEFFEPAKPLLLAAPWVIMRGNHEDCDRAGAGWNFLFGLPPRGSGDACDSDLESYNVSIGNTGQTADQPSRRRVLRVMDTSYEKSAYKTKPRCEQYAEALTPLVKNDWEFWLAVHQPLWLRNTTGGEHQEDTTPPDCNNKELKSALEGLRTRFAANPKKRLARLVLSGDMHAFQFFWPKTALTPVQLTAGNGGTALDVLCEAADGLNEDDDSCKDDKRTGQKKYRQIAANGKISEDVKSFGIDGSSLSFARHGFTVLQRTDSKWTATQFSKAGEIIGSCWFSEAPSPGPTAAGCDQIPP